MVLYIYIYTTTNNNKFQFPRYTKYIQRLISQKNVSPNKDDKIIKDKVYNIDTIGNIDTSGLHTCVHYNHAEWCSPHNLSTEKY